MKKHTIIKWLSALVLTLVLALAPAGAARAANYQVKIYPNDYTTIPTSASDSLASRFSAYQIFEGTISDDYADSVGNKDEPHEPPVIGGLEVSGWGSSINNNNYSALLYELTRIPTLASQVNITATRLLEFLKAVPDPTRYTEWLPHYSDPENWYEDSGIFTWAGAISQKDAITEDLKRLTLGDIFYIALTKSGYEVDDNSKSVAQGTTADTTLSQSAAIIADVLNSFTEATGNAALAEVFAKVVEKYLNISPYAKSSWQGDNIGSGYWTIDLDGGYYLFIDNTGTADQSDYILAVLGNQSIRVKSYAPTVDKVIVNGSNDNAYGYDFEVGDTITFRITGTLPENIDNYETYQYNFADYMSAGLSYVNGSMKVYAQAPGGGGSSGRIYLLSLSINEDGASPSGNPSFSGPVPDPDPGSTDNIIYVNFDLKDNSNKITGRQVSGIGGNPSGTAASQDLTITTGWKIVIQYQARLNNSAVADSNTNKVKLTYSNSVRNNDGSTETTTPANNIYTFGMDILKYFMGIDEADDTGDEVTPVPIPLSDAGFALTKKNTVGYENITYYAFSYNGSSSADKIIWLTLDDIRAYTGIGSFRLSDLVRSYRIAEKSPVYNGPLKEFTLYDWGPVFVDNSVVSETRRKPSYGNVIQYALFEKVAGESDDGSDSDYYLYGWISESELKKYLGVTGEIKWDDERNAVLKKIKDLNGQLSGPQSGSTFQYEGKYIYIVTEDIGSDVTENENNLHIRGLKDETYTLSEVIIPEGFKKLKDITVEFVAEYYSTIQLEAGDPGTLKNLYYTVNDNNNYAYIVKEGSNQPGFTELIARLEVQNDPALPRTGGMGTALFYVGGSVLLIGAALILILSNVRKKRGSKENPE